MYKRICTVAVVLGLLVGLVPTAAPAQGAVGKIYWTDSNDGGTAPAKVSGSNLDAFNLEVIVGSSTSGARYMALDPVGGKVYWIESGAIRRANLNGGTEEIFMAGLLGPMGIAIHPAARHIYWTDTASDTVNRANLDDTSVRIQLAVSGEPRALAVDAAAGHIYWTERTPSTIRRANLDLAPASVVTVMPSLVASSPGLLIEGIALDPSRGKFYWADLSFNADGALVGRIRRANLDGTGVEDIVIPAVNGMPAHPTGVALDTDGGKVYWTVYWAVGIGGKIQRANLDGTGGIQEFGTGLDTPWGLALQPAVKFELTVGIDIKPGGNQNSINRGSHGVVPVAILSAPGFDAPTEVDVNPMYLTFGRTGTEASLASCTASPQDVNEDGLADLVCHFYTDQTGFQPGDTQGVLRGRTLGGQEFVGVDAVRIIF